MKQVKQGVTVLAEYAYDDLGRVTGIGRANSTSTILGYGATSLDRSLTQDLANAGQDVGFSMGFTAAQQMVTRSITNSAYRFSAPAVSKSYTRNGLNQYTVVGGDAFVYDGRGNLTSDSARAFAYDLENRLTGVSGAASMALAYDPRGRMRQTAASATQQYLYDGDDLIVEYDNGGTILRRYVPGRGEDETLVWYEGSNLSTPSWLYTDQQGSLVNVANSAGSGGTPYRYSPSGEPEGGWGSGPATPIFRYTGQAALPQIGLYYYKARMYDPALGRFLQTDPIGYKDDWNLYAYVGNDPANKTDPSGEGGIRVYFCPPTCIPPPATGGYGQRSFGDWAARRLTDWWQSANAPDRPRGDAPPLPSFISPNAPDDSSSKTADPANALPKPPTGKGSAEPADRDPKRFFNPEEREIKRQEQGGKCGNGCGTDLTRENSAGHHVDRHADGGKTIPNNHVEVCIECHKKLHGTD